MAEEEICLNKQVLDYLHTYAKDIHLEAPEFYVTRACKKGDNFSGLVYSIRIEGKKNNTVKNIQIVLKTPNFEGTHDQVHTTKTYDREIFFYQEVIPIFQKNLKMHGGMADLFPAFYCANKESGRKILIMENLKIKGFTMNSSKIMDYPHTSLAIKYLGELHAYSFITRAADPVSFDKLKQMDEAFLFESREFDQFIVDMSHILIKALIGEEKHYFERYQQFASNILSHLADAINRDAAEPYAVVNHGDCWTNNILFKYDQKTQEGSQEKRPCDLRFLDLQISRYGSPALDIVYLIFCCTTQETRSKYYDQLIDEYYEALSKRIEKSGYDPNILFPREALSKQLMKFGKYAAALCTTALHIFSDTKGEHTDLPSALDLNKIEQRIHTDNFFRYLVKGAFKDLIDKNYI